MKLLPASIVVAGAIIAGGLLYRLPPKEAPFAEAATVLPAALGGLEQELVREGVIDSAKWQGLYPEKLAHEDKKGRLVITRENAGHVLNLLWALGLGNKNRVLEEGPMSDPRYGGAGNFASTGGWTLARGPAMDHYGMHEFMVLGEAEQESVERVAKEIFRPCCSNPAYFPDCNHGMAMLGLLELMASQGAGEEEMRRAAHAVNSYWFPEFYEKNNNSNSSCAVS